LITLDGKYNTAKVFTDNVEETAISQIIELCNQSFTESSKIRIMPDVHAGAGCTIGTTMEVKDKIVSNLVGVDQGCGMFHVDLGYVELDLPAIDNFIRQNIPHGHSINKEPKANFKNEINSLICLRDLHKSTTEFNLALGSLGGGNHFIEINQDNSGNKHLVIHSGSRNMGLQIANYYQDRAFDYHNGIDDEFEIEKKELIREYKETGKQAQIPNAIDVLKKKHKRVSSIPKALCYLEGQLMKDYLHDLNIAQQYAKLNRETMAKRILDFIGINYDYTIHSHTVHNYIDLDNMILRKGAVSAQKGEVLLIPMNMRDGSLICIGKGNPDWNFSAPHGAGRLMSRTSAKENIAMEDFTNSMRGIYSTSVTQNTLDESPMAYKPIQEIIDNIKDTVDIIDIIRPIYNFKAN
jgi:tRNA-splicing ligase RtcB (3'-phosphate/5'-hydroxy nucleic acid ligase)